MILLTTHLHYCLFFEFSHLCFDYLVAACPVSLTCARGVCQTSTLVGSIGTISIRIPSDKEPGYQGTIPFCYHGTCSGLNVCACPADFTGPTCATPLCNPACVHGIIYIYILYVYVYIYLRALIAVYDLTVI